MQNYNPCAIHVAPPKTWLLREARNPDDCWYLKRCANLFCEPNSSISRFQKKNVIFDNLNVCHHGPKFERPIVLHHNISRNSPFHNLSPHHHGSGWTKQIENERHMFEHRTKTNQKVKIVAGHDWCKLPPAVKEYCLKRYQLESWAVSTEFNIWYGKIFALCTLSNQLSAITSCCVLLVQNKKGSCCFFSDKSECPQSTEIDFNNALQQWLVGEM